MKFFGKSKQNEESSLELPANPVITPHSATIQKETIAAPRQGLGEELIEVYENSGDELNSLTTIEHRRRNWQKVLAWILLFLVAVFVGVAAVSWYIWGRQAPFSGDRVRFEIETKEEVRSGEEITYLVQYANEENVSFRKSEIELRYPSGFIFISADPQPASATNVWDLGSLAVMQDGKIEVKGILVGHPDQPTTLSGVMRYWPSNFTSEFQEVTSAQVLVKAAAIDARLEGPEQVLVGQKGTYTVIFSNDAGQAIKNLRFELIYPTDFVAEKTKPEGQGDKKNLFDFAEVKPQEELEIQIEGYFSAAGEEPVSLIAEASLKGSTDEYFVQKQLKSQIAVVRGDLVVNVIVNGSNKDGHLQWGETIHAALAYQNNSEATLSDMKVVATLESRYRTQKAPKGSAGALDFASLVDSQRGSLKELPPTDDKTLRKRSITWTAEELDSLAELKAKEEDTINLQISAFSLAAASRAIDHPEDVELVLSVQVVVGKTGGVQEEMKVTGNPIRLAMSSDTNLDAHARYYDDEGNQLGSGPLPPQVGQKTGYRVIFKLTNTLHEVKDVVVTTDLPENVAWSNDYQVSAGEVISQSSDNTLSWKLNRLPLDVKEATLSFKVDLNPTPKQVGELAPLTKKITMTALDTVTNGKIVQSISGLTNGADRDKEASEKAIITQ